MYMNNDDKGTLYFVLIVLMLLMLFLGTRCSADSPFKGVWLWCGYQINDSVPSIITYSIKFDEPTAGRVTFADIGRREIKVYAYAVNEIHECIKIGKYNYLYQKIDDELYYLTQFPAIDFENKTVEGEYNFYVIIKSDMFADRVGEIDTFFNLMFSGGD